MLRARAHLLRWLGPWTGQNSVPRNIDHTVLTIPAAHDADRPFEAWLYHPRRQPVGAYLIAPGLHYAGPADPRMDRFAKILCNAGFVVLVPFLPDFIALRVEESVIGDLARAFDALIAHQALPQGIAPGVFSISFGSLPALRLAADPARADKIGSLVVFGGFADFNATARFCLGEGADGQPRDPLNQPVIFMNLLDQMEAAPADSTALQAAWMRYIRAAWGQPEMKAPQRWRPVAESIAAELDRDLRALFRIGCGLDDGAFELCARALEQLQAARPYLDPRPHLSGVQCSVGLVHGVDDDVIPDSQLEVLAAAMPREVKVVTHRTGLYGHTGQSGLRVGALTREIGTLLRVLGVISSGATQRR